MPDEPPHRQLVAIEAPFLVPAGKERTALPWAAAAVAEGSRIADPPSSMFLRPPEILPRVDVEHVMSLRPSSDCMVPLQLKVSAGNDLLLKVTRHIRVRRSVDAHTGTVSETIEPSGEEVSCVGVISRSASLFRPGDFQFAALETRLDGARGAVVRDGDVFSPSSFISERAVSSFAYQFEPPLCAAHEEGDDVSAIRPNRTVRSTVVGPHSALPPPQMPEQLEYLRVFGNTVECAVLSECLRQRPVWSQELLIRVMMESGRCSTSYACVCAIRCMTYALRTGPFNRLRVAYGCDPTSDARFGVLQRLTVRMARRTALGVAIRDASRVPTIRNVMERAASAVLNAGPCDTSASPFAPVADAKAFVMDVVCNGRLFRPVQLVDVLDAVTDEVFRTVNTYDHVLGFYTADSWRKMTASLMALLHRVVDRVPQCLEGPADDADSDASESRGSSFGSEELMNDSEPSTDSGGKRSRSESDEEWIE